MPRTLADGLPAEIAPDAPSTPVTVDLVKSVVVSPGGRIYPFSIPGLRREALLDGLDEIGLTLKRESEIASHQARDRARRPWIYQTVEAHS